MTYLRISVEESNKEFVAELLSKLGCEVAPEDKSSVASQSKKTVSPTLLFGKWKDIKLNPTSHRKELWLRKG